MLIICTMVYIFFVVIDVIPMMKNKQWKVLAIYSIFIAAAYVLSVLTELGVKIPSPAGPLKQIIMSVIGK